MRDHAEGHRVKLRHDQRRYSIDPLTSRYGDGRALPRTSPAIASRLAFLAALASEPKYPYRARPGRPTSIRRRPSLDQRSPAVRLGAMSGPSLIRATLRAHPLPTRLRPVTGP